MRFLICDTETAGLAPPPKPASGVVEIAYLELDMDTLEVKDEFYSRTNPGCPITSGAGAIHGITDFDVMDSPKLEDVFNVTGPVIFAGHNSPFDYRFLSHYLDNVVGNLCTLQLARQYIKDSENHKLGTLVRHLNLPQGSLHNALADCHMAAHLLRYIVDKSGRDLKTHVAAARKPKVITNMPFGKYKGQRINTLPKWYIDYFADKEVDPDLRYSFDQALRMRA